MFDDRVFSKNFEERVNPLLDTALQECEKQRKENKGNADICSASYAVDGQCTYPATWSVRKKDSARIDLLCEFHKVYWEEAVRVVAPDKLSDFEIISFCQDTVQ